MFKRIKYNEKPDIEDVLEWLNDTNEERQKPIPKKKVSKV